MSKRIVIDPLTRIEGHLAIKIAVSNGAVEEAHSMGEMFRGFEQILRGRDPLDAQQITQRICGVCPVSHGIASVEAQDEAYGIRPTPNGQLLRNLILGANYLQSHIVHFYTLSALDFVDIAAITKYSGKDPLLRDLRTWVETQQKSKVLYPVAPFLPRYEGTYVENYDVNIQAIRNFLSALEMRKISHEMAVLFAGKLPHAATIIPGGIAEGITAKKIAAYKSKLKQVKTFVETCYIPDVEQIASAFIDHFGFGKGCGNYMAFGVFREDASGKKKLFPEGMLIDGVLQEVNPNAITEHIKYSFFDSASKLHPYQGTLNPAPKKGGDAYSWLKAPRYDGKPIEVGPLARVLVAYQKGDSNVKPLVDHYLGALGGGLDMLDSVMGRHLARALEAKIIAQRCEEWLEMLRPDDPTFTDFDIPEKGQGAGLTEAPRGALGHWLKVAGHKIENYQCVVPSTWNCSPRDDAGVPGPVEQALVGTPIADEHNPIEATRVVRAFDPCLACAVH